MHVEWKGKKRVPLYLDIFCRGRGARVSLSLLNARTRAMGLEIFIRR